MPYSVVHDAPRALMSIANIDSYFKYRSVSFPSLSCTYECTYLSYLELPQRFGTQTIEVGSQLLSSYEDH